MDFSVRSQQPELLDRPDITAADTALNLQELECINRMLGGHAVTLDGFRTLAAGSMEITVAEVGCGGGDNLLAIQQKADPERLSLHSIGLALNADCIRFEKKVNWKKLPEFLTGDTPLIDRKSVV